MIEAVRISRSAYPNRLPFTEFYERYRHFKSLTWQHTYILNDKMSYDDSHALLVEACTTLLMHTLLDPVKLRVPATIGKLRCYGVYFIVYMYAYIHCLYSI